MTGHFCKDFIPFFLYHFTSLNCKNAIHPSLHEITSIYHFFFPPFYPFSLKKMYLFKALYNRIIEILILFFCLILWLLALIWPLISCRDIFPLIFLLFFASASVSSILLFEIQIFDQNPLQSTLILSPALVVMQGSRGTLFVVDYVWWVWVVLSRQT